MSQVQNLITQHLDIWTQAIESKSSAGRGTSNKFTLVGIKKLRELILEMAVRGLLVPQDPNDEPASELLKKIAAEKAQLIKDGKIKKSKPMPEITEDEKPFELPMGWAIAANSSVFELVKGKKPKNVSEINGKYPYLDIEALDRDNILRFTDDESAPKCTRQDLLVVCDGSRSGLVLDGKDGVIGSTLARLDISECLKPFIKLFFQNAYQHLNATLKGAAIPHLDTKALRSGVLAVPPLEEQKRIVAKVDELMGLCDQLEQQTLESMKAHQTLVEVLLNGLVNAENAAKFNQAWLNLAQNFDILFTTEHSINTLKQTILQLAVMGKLVPQNPNDQPASKLLEKIAAEKAQLIKQGKLKKSKPLPPITEEEKPFELPNGWEWVRFGELLQISSGDGLTSKQMNEQGGIPVFGGNGINGFHDKSNLIKPTLVIGRVGYYCGSIHKTPENAWVTDNAFEVKFSESNIDIDFLYWLLKGTNLKENDNATAQPVISGRKVNPIPLGLPPLDEQKNIVEKLNELMNLCDQLKTQLQTTQQTQLAQSITQEVLV